MALALIFGASGISGWAISKECLEYLSSEAFRRVTAVTSRMYMEDELRFPYDSRLQVIGGINLTKTVEEISESLQAKSQHVNEITHIFYTAYVEEPDSPERKQINTNMLRDAIEAILHLSGRTLKAVILQTGAKYYGVDFLDQNLLNFPQLLLLPIRRLQRCLPATVNFYEIRPDVIVGFTPSNNAFNLAQGLAFFFTLFREVRSEGADVPFIGSWKAWKCTHMDTAQDILARQSIHIALNTDRIPSGTSFNCADNATITTWEQKCPHLAAYFGLRDVLPGPLPLDVGTFAMMNLDRWNGIERNCGLRKGLFESYDWPFITNICSWYYVDREMDLSNSRKYDFQEEGVTCDGYRVAWERMKHVRIIL